MVIGWLTGRAVVQPDGKVIVGGSFSSIKNTAGRRGLEDWSEGVLESVARWGSTEDSKGSKERTGLSTVSFSDQLSRSDREKVVGSLQA